MTKPNLSVTIPFLACILNTATSFSPAEIHKTPIKTQLSAAVLPRVESFENNEEANGTRRAFLSGAIAFVFATPTVCHATYGEDAKIQLPDIVQGMSDRTNKQCLVESLGNRECLVYIDPDNQLYKGSDARLLFERLGGAVTALRDIPTYIESKQWAKVQGVLTGPMGNLSSTMNELTKNADGNGQAMKKLSVDIRTDLYAINSAVDRKNGKDAMVAYEKAESKLEKFITMANKM